MNTLSTPDLALGLYALFLALAFGLRSLVQLRRTGSTGFRGISGRPGSVEWLGGVLFAVALALGVAGCVLQRAHVVAPLALFDRVEVRLTGFALFALGTVATLGAQVAMGASWRIGVDASERTALVTSGPFRIVRNPIFSAMLAGAAGLSLLVPNAVSLGAVVLLLCAVEIQVRLVEEPYLIQTHGADYLAYAAKTGRFLPFVGRLRGNHPE
ncbi:MAG: isoprenylcysteine carboxylmethyltransferase family protein [Polyangiaceae bacterium]|nr:isoprenylcysteine carboxylmethyltransferase family protein [Polyangiaceae bacterium]